jgi:hypothetical protein
MKMRVDFYAQELGVLRHCLKYCSRGTAGAGTQFHDGRGGCDGGGPQDALFKESGAGDYRAYLHGVFQKFLKKGKPPIQQGFYWFLVYCLFFQANSYYRRLTATI